MSWYINVVGKPDEVKQVAAAHQYLPQPLKDTVALFAESLNKENATASNPALIQMQLTTSGHYWSEGQCSVNEFSVKPAPQLAIAFLAKPEAPATVAPPAS